MPSSSLQIQIILFMEHMILWPSKKKSLRISSHGFGQDSGDKGPLCIISVEMSPIAFSVSTIIILSSPFLSSLRDNRTPAVERVYFLGQLHIFVSSQAWSLRRDSWAASCKTYKTLGKAFHSKHRQSNLVLVLKSQELFSHKWI